MNHEETIDIIQELLKSIKIRGFKKTLNILKTSKQTEIELSDPFERFVIKTVAEAFSINEDDLLYSKYVRGDNKYAIGLCVYYLYLRKSLGEIHKRLFVNKNKTLLSKYRQIIIDLNSSHSEDQKILSIKIDLDAKIDNYLKDNQ
jgi:hypothetical protein